MTESMPPEGGPLTLVQTQQLHRSLTEKVLDRAESDPEWRQLLIDDPELAMREANFPEARQLKQQGPQRGAPWSSPREGEVVGQEWSIFGSGWTPYWFRRHGWYGHGYGYNPPPYPGLR